MTSYATILQWLGEQIVPLFFIGFAILMGTAMVYFSWRTRRSSLARQRAGRTPENFAEYLSGYGFDPEIARTAYIYLQERTRVDFPIEPTDDLDRDLGLYGEESNEALRDLLDETGREYLPGLIDQPLVTVVDLIRYVQASPRRMVIRRRTA